MATRHRNIFALLLLSLAAIATGCPPSSAGDILNEFDDDLGFVADNDQVFVVTDEGMIRIQVDGSQKTLAFGPGYLLRNTAADLSLWALGDSETNLFLMNGPGETPRRVPDLDKRTGSIAITSDGSRVAVTRHADYDLPQAQQTNDDAIYLIDPESLEVEILEAHTDQRMSWLIWSQDDSLLYGSTHDQHYQIDPETNERELLASLPEENIRRPPYEWTECPSTGATLTTDDAGIYLTDSEGNQEHLVEIAGRERGFHDYQDTIAELAFTESCDNVVFSYNQNVWVVGVESRLVGRLIEGRSLHIIRPFL